MGLKVADVYSTVNTKQNIFYSAYLKNKVQYNDVDPDKVINTEALIENTTQSDDDSSTKEDDSKV